MDTHKNSILIADDAVFSESSLSHILQQEYTLYTVKCGAECLEQARKVAPDLILLDIVLPGMNGFDVIMELKRNALTQEIPVIIVTGLNNAEDEERGFLLGAADYISKPYTPAVVKLRVKNQIQIVNQIRHIQTISATDELTGIGNRRYFYDQLELEWQRAMRNRKPLSFMMVDIDHFKPYNDTYGHLQGDRALKTVAQTIKISLTRAIDRAARWGGEEFVVILPDTKLDGARTVGERIRNNVESLNVPLIDGTPTAITVSIGIHCITPGVDEDYSLSAFVSDTDKALYYAKDTGRNRVCAAEEAELA